MNTFERSVLLIMGLLVLITVLGMAIMAFEEWRLNQAEKRKYTRISEKDAYYRLYGDKTYQKEPKK